MISARPPATRSAAIPRVGDQREERTPMGDERDGRRVDAGRAGTASVWSPIGVLNRADDRRPSGTRQDRGVSAVRQSPGPSPRVSTGADPEAHLVLSPSIENDLGLQTHARPSPIGEFPRQRVRSRASKAGKPGLTI
jgi:hypothetical protein